MILAIVLLIGVPALCAVLYWVGQEFFGVDGFGFFVALGFLSFFALLVPTIREIEHHYGKQSCANYTRDIGRETRWVDHSYWDYGCYVKTADGWVLKGEQIEVQNP